MEEGRRGLVEACMVAAVDVHVVAESFSGVELPSVVCAGVGSHDVQ